jgi:hypothetical protein
MLYEQFKDLVERFLRKFGASTWEELRTKLELPHERPSPQWIQRLEREIGLKRKRLKGNALVWSVRGTHIPAQKAQPHLSLGKRSQASLRTRAKQNALKKAGFQTRVKGHLAASNRRAQGKRDGRR